MDRIHALGMLGVMVVLTATVYGLTGKEDSDTVDTAISEADVVVNYTGEGYEPREVTVKKGDTVAWVSEGPAMWTASSSHPTHADYGLDEHSDPAFDQGEQGSMFVFTFGKVGEWQYHNHLNAYHHGTVNVVAEDG